MLFLHEILSVTSNRQDEAVERVGWIHSYMLKHPGFVGARIARYLGAPTEYLVLRMWQSPDDLADYRLNPEIPNWGANRPEGIYTRPPRTTRWRLIAENGETGSNFVVRTIYCPTSNTPDDLAELVRASVERATVETLMLHAEIFRSMEDDEEMTDAVLSLESFADRDAYNAYLRSDCAAELQAASNQYVVIASGCYEIVVEAPPVVHE